MNLKSMHINELHTEENKIIETLKKEQQHLQIMQNSKRSLTKNAMTRRLCDHGRLLEKYFPPTDFSDDQVEMILIGLLQNPMNQKAIEILKCGGHVSW